jgi:hypothetical protein
MTVRIVRLVRTYAGLYGLLVAHSGSPIHYFCSKSKASVLNALRGARTNPAP